tara:strand:- start:3190 stop:3774 length:585 start_codon:yes stop_codon:yes gene_type:complete
MPLIKDKYSKSSKSRSRYIVDRKIVTTPMAVSPYKTTEQKLSDAATARRIEKDITTPKTNLKTDTINTRDDVNNISGRILSTVNIVENIFTLDTGSTLKDIVINHYHESGTSSVMSLHWSFKSIEDLTFTVSTGVITAVTGGNIFRLFTDTFASSTTLSLGNNGLFNTFENVNKPIYFYAVCSVLGPTLTIVKK